MDTRKTLNSAASTALTSALAALMLAGCAALRPPEPAPAAAVEPPVDYVNAGIYEASDPSDAALRVVLFLSPNHGFILRSARKKQSLVEYRGQWSSDPDSLRLAVYDVRRSAPGDSVRTVERLDTVIACPIASGAAQPLPLLKLLSPKGGPRLITLAKPADTAAAWDAKDPRGKSGKKKKGRKTATKTAKKKDAPAAAPPVATGKTGA